MFGLFSNKNQIIRGIKYENRTRYVNKYFKMSVKEFTNSLSMIGKKFEDVINEMPYESELKIKFCESVRCIGNELFDAIDYFEGCKDCDDNSDIKLNKDFLVDFDFYIEQSFDEYDDYGKNCGFNNYKQTLGLFEYVWEKVIGDEHRLFGYDINGEITK